MFKCTINRAIRLSAAVLATLSVGVFSAYATDKPEQTSSEPGFRPDGYFSASFAEALDGKTIAVLPTLIRRSGRTAHSFESQQQIVAYLDGKAAAASAKPKRIDLGPLRRQSQWEIFQYGADSVAEAVKAYETGSDYVLVMEILVPNDQAVFGIELYIVDRDGAHALSFLLNEHHEMFADADLVARNSSEAARSEMILNATAVGLAALDRQLALLSASNAIP